MIVYVARHGKTDENERDLMTGQSDNARLVEEGRQHALNLADFLDGKGVEVIFSSPLTRAIDTAKPVSDRLKIPTQPDKRLMEMDFGTCDGKTIEESMIHVQRRERDLSYRFPGGESYEDVLARVDSFLNDLYSKRLRTVLLMGHGGVNRAVLARLTQVVIIEPKRLTKIGINNSVVHRINTMTAECSWYDTITRDSSEGLLYSV